MTNCYDSVELSCTHGEVQTLIGGALANEGVLEVCYEGDFLPLLLSGVTISEASVVCRQLNLSRGTYSLRV